MIPLLHDTFYLFLTYFLIQFLFQLSLQSLKWCKVPVADSLNEEQQTKKKGSVHAICVCVYIYIYIYHIILPFPFPMSFPFSTFSLVTGFN